MIVFPNCKINLGLHITRKRADGYHDIDTVFYPVPLEDALECIHAPSSAEPIAFTASGLPVAGNASDNLCVKAWYLLKKDFPDLPPVQMHLHKAIPMGAGLGGGSADGAFALQLLSQLFHLNLSTEQLEGYALQLGSDCPFFIRNRPCHATGRGEQMQPVQTDLSGYTIVVVHPGIHISTAKAFAGITPHMPERSLAEIIALPVTEWKEHLVNDFEKSIASDWPAIAGIKQQLYAAGAAYASMSGSGSAVYGLFPKENKYQLPAFPAQYSIHTIG
jgi:4-diphosphocytidyl-2-C-methyl-D-erythritol kinase